MSPCLNSFFDEFITFNTFRKKITMDSEGFSFDDFSIEMEDYEVKKVEKFDRMWSAKPGGGSSINTPIVVDNIVYFGSSDCYLYAVELQTGKEI